MASDWANNYEQDAFQKCKEKKQKSKEYANLEWDKMVSTLHKEAIAQK